MSATKSKRTAQAAVFLFLGLIVVAGFGVASYLRATPPPTAPQSDCEVPPQTIEPVDGWLFRLDPDDTGIAQAWFADVNEEQWDRSAPGVPWEQQGYEGYDGVAWYRATFQVPAGWEQAYLGTNGVDDSAHVWVDGREVPAHTLIELPAGGQVQVTYRVKDEGGPGGIKQPVRVGRQVRAALPGGEYIRWLAGQHPSWPFPGWARDTYHAWTFTGAPQAENEAIISSQAAVAPWAEAPLVELWLLDEAGTLVTPTPDFSLLDGALPIPQARWQMGDLAFATTLFADFHEAGTFWTTHVENPTSDPIAATVLVVVRPLAIEEDRRLIHAAGFDERDRLWLDGQLFTAASVTPDQVGVGSLLPVMDGLQRSELPPVRELGCAPAGNATAVMAFPLALASGEKWSLSLSFPSSAGAGLPDPGAAEARLPRTRTAWQGEIDAGTDVHVPDDMVMNAYRASIGYLRLALDPNGPHPGPLEHDALWVRDAAYIGQTLLRLGHEEIVASYLPSLLEHQREDGYVPAIIGPDGPRPDQEWDAQGQLIFLIAELYRYNEDAEALAERYPHVRAAASFLQALRRETADDPPSTRGILPPSKSAEDLGPAGWHHYWDDFWAITGLEDAAFIAAELGHTGDARWMQEEADALRRALRASIEAVMGPEPAYIPNGPEDTTSSAMARGSTNSLYPTEVFSRTDPLVLRSFDAYYERWIAPDGGGYRHIHGQWWPYGGMGLARDYVRLGRRDVVHEILGWTLTHQTLPGTFAWAEQVDPETGGFSGGDMPHAWAASSYIALVREMLVFRDGEALELFAGVPGSWLTAGKTVSLADAPTPYGPLTVETGSDLAISGDEWAGTVTLTVSGAQPPAGFRWRLPHAPTQVNGPDGTDVRDGWLTIPRSGGTITLVFGP